MESIIIWIVIIVAGYVFEQLKKRAEQKKAEEETLNRHHHNAHNATRGVPRPAPASAQEMRRPRPAPAQVQTMTPSTTVKTAKPQQPAYKPLDIPETEMDMEIVELTDEMETASSTPAHADRSTEAHYARWRQAILDTQVLERKF